MVITEGSLSPSKFFLGEQRKGGAKTRTQESICPLATTSGATHVVQLVLHQVQVHNRSKLWSLGPNEL